ncbi:MAG TPA: Uma2 family endonuclease [Micromonosporaceae bacterium]
MTLTERLSHPATEPWTLDDLGQLPEDGQRYEIFEGSLLVSPHADVWHGRIANQLRRLLDRQAPDDLFVGQDVGVANHRRTSYFVPDLFVCHRTALERRAPALDPSDVLLVAEVLSPTNAGRDLVLKRHSYAAAGIGRYWLVDPQGGTLTVLALDEHGYHEEITVTRSSRWSTDSPFPLTLDLADVL